jgi:uncharacterized membrane protein YbhN (UPF0104 family)
MCVASATAEDLMDACLTRLGVAHYFSFLLSCETIGAGKSRPDVYFEAAKRLGAQPEDIAVFEDALYAANTAKQAGFYTIAIWASYFLHYWLTFKCFNFTEELGFTAAIVSFIVGSISVIVPTPNGAGPWHFAVKTILVLYGVASVNAEAFALIVHTIQTALVPLLGIFSIAALSTRTLAATHSSNKQ